MGPSCSVCKYVHMKCFIHLNNIWWIIYGRRSFTIRCKYHQIKYKASPKPSNERYHSRLSRLTHAFPDVGQIVEHGVDRVNCRFRLMSAKSSVTRFWSTCCSIASDHLDLVYNCTCSWRRDSRTRAPLQWFQLWWISCLRGESGNEQYSSKACTCAPAACIAHMLLMHLIAPRAWGSRNVLICRHESGEYYAIDLGGTNLRLLYTRLGKARKEVVRMSLNQRPVHESH